jgi:peptidoglycan/LPS O-acetylase OafA/YrhL
MYSTATGVAMLVGTAAVTVLLSWALYALVEAPLVRRFSRSRRA